MRRLRKLSSVLSPVFLSGIFPPAAFPLAVFLLVSAALLAAPAGAQIGPTPAPAVRVESGQSQAAGSDPVAVAAYGKLFDASGRIISVTPKFLRETLDFYIEQLTSEAGPDKRADVDERRRRLAETFRDDDMVQKFLLLDYLTGLAPPAAQARMEVRGHVLRRLWYEGLYGIERYRDEIDERSALPFKIRDLAEERGILAKATTSSGKKYIEECRKAEVPIPPGWGNAAWKHVGNLTTNFLGFGNPAEVWRWDSSSPKGLCVALPRVDGSNISALGIICLGRESSNACFFDAENVPVGASKPISDFLGGTDLFNGVCTDCHAGENPYVVHPGGPLDMRPDNHPAQFYTPLIKPSWPQNPGPFGLLAMVPINELPPVSDGSCLSCHVPGDAGRFPDILALNAWAGGQSDYCRVIVKSAIGNTMPGPGGPFDKHVQAMLAFCGQSTPEGGDVPPVDKDDPQVVSPPLLLGPLYACVDMVEVGGGIYDAKITVSVNGNPQPSVQVKTPSKTLVKISPPLVAGDVVNAVQEKNGVVSKPSPDVVVLDHTVAYPFGLPAPKIDPTRINECGRTIAVRHIKGATVTVFTNGGTPATYSTGGDWSNLPPAIRPFVLADRYKAQQKLCKDVSPDSAEESAVSPPAPMPVPKMDPPVAGQPLVAVSNLAEGAQTTIDEASAGTVSSFSTAVTWNPEVDVATALGRNIKSGDTFTVISELCDGTKVEIPPARPCKSLDPPKIATPLVGQNFVTVTSAAPGARILVYDASLAKIGDGSGITVGLTRKIKFGDVLKVMQRLEECTSSQAYQTGVVCASNKDCG
ncbi:hypothetical protein [Jiella sonneratiae]|uniref:Cytochrome c domain-containing protein n=1 Tax=Jiella sonneratiae TaxID=2816856 RepID=A0ABS3J006_9HYPH|nr:hypothetical protein [Jiella sonneratiae]MBO0902991.1 hypothetical protein [Jiella sonneratiae]